jgi:hypothetical protein
MMRGWLREIAVMDRRDRELLNKQVNHLQPETRREGLLLVALAAVFLAGLAAGGLLFANSPSRTASDDGRTALAFFLNGSGISRQ